MKLTCGSGGQSRPRLNHPAYGRVVNPLLALGLFVAGAALAAPSVTPTLPPGRDLTESEAALWVSQGIDEPSDHLASLAGELAAGGTAELRVAVILVDFPDLPADRITYPPEHYEELLFSHGVLPGKSVAEYLSISSGGRLELTGDVRGWFTVSEDRDYYSNVQGGLGWYPRNSQGLAEEAIYLADPFINYAHLDNEGPDGVPDSGDDDEIIDGLIVVHAGPGREVGGTGPNDFVSLFWKLPKQFPADGVFGKFFTLNPEPGNIGIFIHELGHLLGLPDLYDTDGGSYGMGVWSMMSGGFLIDQGRTPSDFDAWCKSKLGFVDVATVLQYTPGLVIAPTVESGLVYRLWRDAFGGTEYFLLENRRQAGLDQGLPGEGLLIYHVDETLGGNTFPNHYKVAVEQADGLFQLENRFNDINSGDAGDPFSAGDVFGRYSVPSSFDYDGVDTNVRVFNIDGPDASGAMTADVNVEKGPVLDVVDLTLVELTGNGNGLMEPGEMVGVSVGIAVSQRPATGVVLTARSLDTRGILLDGVRQIGSIPVGQTYVISDPFPVQISSDIPTDPYGLAIEMQLNWDNAPGRVVPVELGIGTVVGREDDFEGPDHGWTHESVRPTAFDQWAYGASFGRDGSAGFKHGYFNGGYQRGSDAVLTSPPILLSPNSTLLFDQLVDIVNPDTNQVRAGGVIELSINGADWQTAFPEGGYPAYFEGEHLEWIGRPMFSGRYMNREFHTVRVDLSPYAGSIRVRFHFFAERDSRIGEAWRIDNVRVTNDVTPVRVLSVDSRIEGEDVHLSWSLADPLPASMRLSRGFDPLNAEPVGPGWRLATPEGSVVDEGGVSRLPAVYWIEGLERDGALSRWGPWRVEAPTLTVPWRAVGSPTRGTTRFTWSGALPERASLQIFDVRGRLVFENAIGGREGSFAWEGKDTTGLPVRPGVYFARIRGTRFTPLRIVRLP